MVERHKRIRKSCVKCCIGHKDDRFHGLGSFKETHKKYCTNPKNTCHDPKSPLFLEKKEPPKNCPKRKKKLIRKPR